MRKGSLVRLANVGNTIKEEMSSLKRRRQVVSVLLINPNGKAICLCASSKAISDGRLNLSPPQGQIEQGELIYGATVRELREELGVTISGQVIYLGSTVRELPADHPHREEFDEFHYHWTAVFAETASLCPAEQFESARWHYLTEMSTVQQLSMSKDKAAMFAEARQELVLLSKDPYLIRKERLGGFVDMVA